MSLPSPVLRESKAHFGLPGYAPGTIAVNVTWMESGTNHRKIILPILYCLIALC